MAATTTSAGRGQARQHDRREDSLEAVAGEQVVEERLGRAVVEGLRLPGTHDTRMTHFADRTVRITDGVLGP